MKNIFTGVSSLSHSIDLITLVLTGICAFVAIGIFICIGYFCFRYHASKNEAYEPNYFNERMEIIYLSVTLVVFMSFFFWATHIYREEVIRPNPDYKIFVYGKRWMWKFQHETGLMEINTVHLPHNKEVQFVMISKDVIHSFFLPAFRIKQDVVPEMFTHLSIHPKLLGSYPLFCAEYCGTSHSGMKGKVEVIPETQYVKFIGDETMRGRKLFEKHQCMSCHTGATPTGPRLLGLNDDERIRQAILYPNKEITPGYQGVMPSYKGVLEEEEVRDLIEYVKHIKVHNEKLL